MNKSPIEFKSSFYRRHVDDIFLLSESPISAHSFYRYMSSKQKIMNFTVEQDINGSHLLLDVEIRRKKGQFYTSLYRNPIFSRVLRN